jgi:hypothetical protein
VINACGKEQKVYERYSPKLYHDKTTKLLVNQFNRIVIVANTYYEIANKTIEKVMQILNGLFSFYIGRVIIIYNKGLSTLFVNNLIIFN